MRWMTWRAFSGSLAGIALHIIGCRVTLDTRVQRALEVDDVAGNLRQALPPSSA